MPDISEGPPLLTLVTITLPEESVVEIPKYGFIPDFGRPYFKRSFKIGFRRFIGTNIFQGVIVPGEAASATKSEPIPNISPLELTSGAPAQD